MNERIRATNMILYCTNENDIDLGGRFVLLVATAISFLSVFSFSKHYYRNIMSMLILACRLDLFNRDKCLRIELHIYRYVTENDY